MYLGNKKNVYRVVAIVSCFVMIAIEILHFRDYASSARQKGFYEIVTDVVNIFSLFVFFFMIFFPQKIELFGGLSFLYTFLAVFFEPGNAISFMLFLLGITTLYLRGFMKKNGKRKIIITVVIYMLCLLTELRFGFDIFISSVLEKTGFFLTSIMIYVFLEEYLKSVYLSPHNKHLDLTQFDLTERDKEWIKLILNNEKYDYIAKLYNLNAGTVKNNCHRIYKILQVSDRQDFITKYAGFKFLYNSAEVKAYEQEKKKMINQ